MSGLIFVNNANESEDLGTDFYNEKLEKVKTVPYKNNYGYLFSSGPNTWHGMEKKEHCIYSENVWVLYTARKMSSSCQTAH